MENYCQIGTPVQFFEWNGEYFNKAQAAIISGLSSNKTKVNISVFPSNGDSSFIIMNIRHSDFKKEGSNYWNYIPQQQP